MKTPGRSVWPLYYFEDLCTIVDRLQERRRLLQLVAPAKEALAALDNLCAPYDYGHVRANLSDALRNLSPEQDK